MTEQAQPSQQPPTMEQMTSVANAGAEAAAAAETPEEAQRAAAQAMRADADRQQMDIPDEVIEKIAAAVSSKNIEELAKRGAFDAPPEPVAPAPTAPEAAAPAEPSTEAPAPEPTQAGPPRRPTFAERFMGS